MNNNTKKIIENLTNYCKNYGIEYNKSINDFYNLDNLIKIKKILIELAKNKTIINSESKKKILIQNNKFKNRTKELNKILDNKILEVLKKKINEILKKYLNSLPNSINDAKDIESINKTKLVIDNIYNELLEYYIDLKYCYNLNLNNATLKSRMDNFLRIHNLKELPNDYDYYKSLSYDKCETRILNNIRYCIKIIVFLFVNFNYDSGLGLLKEITYYNEIPSKKNTFSRFKTMFATKEKSIPLYRNITKKEFIDSLYNFYCNIHFNFKEKYEKKLKDSKNINDLKVLFEKDLQNIEEMGIIIDDFYWIENELNLKLNEKNYICKKESNIIKLENI